MGALIAADGKKDPKAKGKNKDKIWRYYAYIEDVEPYYPCHILEYEDDVKAIGEQPKEQKPITRGGGGGGGGEEETPAPQEPIPEKTPAELKAQNFTAEESDRLRKCVEEDLGSVSEDIEGWNSEAIGAEEVTWGIDTQSEKGFGFTRWDVDEDNKGKPKLSIFSFIRSKGIGYRRWCHVRGAKGCTSKGF